MYVYVCMYVYTYECMYECMYVCMYVHIPITYTPYVIHDTGALTVRGGGERPRVRVCLYV
jgi:hypothetical protein